MLNSRILIIAEDKIYGPFDTQVTAQAWLDAPHSVGGNPQMYQLWDRETGTAEAAHECGSRLQDISEATTRSSRKTSAA
jgi:hypothetical protein